MDDYYGLLRRKLKWSEIQNRKSHKLEFYLTTIFPGTWANNDCGVITGDDTMRFPATTGLEHKAD